MNTENDNEKSEISQQDMMKQPGLAHGGQASGDIAGSTRPGDTPAHDPKSACHRPSAYPSDRYSYFSGDTNGVGGLDLFDPNTKLEENEMRISFMGSMFPPPRRAQQQMSIFVEVGWVKDEYQAKFGQSKKKAADQFIFDCGTGCSANYNAMNVGFHRMDKVFINHLHGDHMNDLSHIYCFGPSTDRKSPLFVFGPGPSGVKNPKPPHQLYDDGTKAFCKNMREAMRWHSESFSFQGTSYGSYEPPTQQSWGLPCDPVPVCDDPINDAYAMVPIELDWTKVGGVAYHNKETGVKITHFPVIHARKGAIGYKLEWDSPRGPVSMIYTSDTKPEKNCIKQASGGRGVDVFIHEMIMPPEVLAMMALGLPQPCSPDNPMWMQVVDAVTSIQDSSHTTQGAFGYILSQIDPRPRLTIATHFPTTDDNVMCALESVRRHVPDITWNKDYDPVHKNIVWSHDCMVLRVFAGEERIEQRRAIVSDYSWSPFPPYQRYDYLPPKYATPDGKWDSTAQLDLSDSIESTDPDSGAYHYNADGY